ncbi:DUF7576 family protein [Halarchaeum sp. P4]|uniref:DUF7576 family protein n=1 Tax=Halarchaeum sp. P4 TaxID=3421639 RepID=UPI003EB9072F
MAKRGARDTPGDVEFDRCANCGSELGMDEWQPVSTVEGEDGVLSFYAFCDDACRDAHARDFDVEE